MCEPVSISIAMAAAMAAMAASSASQQAKAEGNAKDTQRKGHIEAVKGMNRNDADYRLQTRDKADEANHQLTEVNLSALRNKGTVLTAIGESGLEGNSMDRVLRITENDSSKEKMAITDNYNRDYATIFATQVVNQENTKSMIRGSGKLLSTPNFAHALNIAGAAVQGGASGYSTGKSMQGSTPSPATK